MYRIHVSDAADDGNTLVESFELVHFPWSFALQHHQSVHQMSSAAVPAGLYTSVVLRTDDASTLS